ncbi:hypothetical protein [Nocardia salmonicida]|uniref:hypothetical protein n=1 Tax=Nocardia salmonicida TaxID=53431 RepID=UPI00379D3461
MDTPSPEVELAAGGTEQAKAGPARQFSTGKLTAKQARTVNAWRRELLRRRPRRYATEDARAPASSSDCLAVIVVELLMSRPAPVDVARYAVAVRLAHQDAQPRRFPGASHVTFYLPAPIADAAEKELLVEARAAHLAAVEEVLRDAASKYPGRNQAGARAEHIHHELQARGLTRTVPKALPVGTLARMAIDRWTDRPAEAVVAAAVVHAARFHEPRRARSDMGTQ